MLRLPTGSVGYPIGVGCRFITFPKVRARAGAAWVRAQRGPNGRSGGCPLDLGMLGLKISGIARPFVACSRLSGWLRRGVAVVVVSSLFFLLLSCKLEPR
jgi:hypothetical protein